MDAANIRITKLSLIPALLLIGATAALAQSPTFQFPNGTNVTLVGLSGGQLGVQSSSSTPIAFTTSTTYGANDNVQWLFVNNAATFTGSTGASGVTLFFQLSSSAGRLVSGVHTATVNLTATDGSGATGALSVSYDTNSTPGGGGTAGITSSPTSLTVPATSGQQSNVNILLTTANATPISFTVTTSAGAPWLSVTPSSGTVTSGSTTTITATLNPSGLSNFSYTANIVVSYNNTTLTIPVTYNVGVNGGGSGGTGSLTVNPSLVQWTFTSGATAPGAQFISLSSSASASTYSATVTSLNTSPWLQINNSNSVSGALLSSGLVISPNPNIYSLATGQYTGTISITANDGSTATVTVNLTVNGATSTGISISPNPINFSATLNGSVVQQQVTVTSSVAGSISASIQQGSGLSVVSLSSGTITQGGSVVVTIAGNPAGLGAQTVVGSLLVTVNGSTSNQLSDQINFTVGNPNTGGGGGGTTSVTALAPGTLNFAYQSNSSMPMTQTQQVYLSGTDTFQVSYPQGQTWITATPLKGLAPGVLNVTINAAGLPAGNNSGTVTLTGASTTVTLTVNVLVTTSAVLFSAGGPGDLYFGYTVGSSGPTLSSQLLIYASDGSNLAVTASVTNPNSTQWLGVSTSSSNPVTPTGFSVTVTPTNLPNGLYQGSITLTSTAANSPVIVPVILVVQGGVNSTGSLSLSSSSITFPQVQQNGAAPAAVGLTVSAAAPTSFSVSATTNNGGNWLTVSPSGAITTNATLSVTANQAGLAVGTYTGQINLTANGVTQTVGVTLVVGTTAAGGSVTVTTNGSGSAASGLSFTAQSGSAPASQYLTISSASGSAAVPFTVTTSTNGGAWLQTSAVSGAQAQTPYNLTVSIAPSGLAAGSYSGTITITPTGGNSVSIPVSLTVTGSPSVTVSATPLTFAFQVGQQNPAAQTVQVSAANASSASFSAQATSSGWLSVSPAAGTAPGSITISVNPAGLAAGAFTGSITVAGINGAGGTTTITVTLTVTAPLPTVTSVVSSATNLAGPVAPGEIVSIYGTFIGPATAVTLILSNGKVSTSIGGVQVYIGGYAAPLIFVSANQINAVVPYEAANLLSPAVLVQYLGQSSNGFNLNRASSAPGIFTANSSGTGPGAILNGDNSFNTSANPTARGGIVQVYLTGEGVTSPAGVTGSVTTVSSSGQLPAPVLPVAVLVNNQPATATFAGEAPGLVAGVLQVNVQIPAGLSIPAGSSVFNAPLVISIGSNSSQPGVTVWVK